jgi:beta-mannosidase
VAIYCGNSEVEQQAAMLGMPRALWRSTLFADVLPELCERWHSGTPYVPSTPTGGPLPFHVGTGLTHYYGVGAYLRPVSDVRRAHVRFTSECLGFANVPGNDVVDLVMSGDVPATHDPRWKRRTPRDTGAGWDFEDVRDHYLQQVFATDPVRLRWSDPARYLELSRVITGELMSQVFSEWRSTFSSCRGGLVWFLKDFWPGAGWGILDSRGRRRRVSPPTRLQPQVVVLTDEGLDGLHAHVINEIERPLSASLELTLLRDGHVVIAEARTRCDLKPRSSATYAFDALLDAFYDVSYAYRFGPAKHDVAAAVLRDDAGQILSEAFWFPSAASIKREATAVSATARALDDHSYVVTLTSDRFLSAAHIDANGFVPDDNYFCLMPGRIREIHLRPVSDRPNRFSASVEALNLDSAAPVDLLNSPGGRP